MEMILILSNLKRFIVGDGNDIFLTKQFLTPHCLRRRKANIEQIQKYTEQDGLALMIQLGRVLGGVGWGG